MSIDFNQLKAKAEYLNSRIAKLIQIKSGEKFLLSDISYEDERTLSLFKNANTDNIFCFESDEIKSALKSCQCKKFADLVSIYAIYKPSNLPEFPKIISSAKESQIFASFKDILEKSGGVPLWSEQIFEIMQKATNCSLIDADLLRRNMGKRNAEILEQNKIQFTEAAIKNNYSKQDAEKLFKDLIPFATYAKSISDDVSIVRISWQNAYFKNHYPEEFDLAKQMLE